MSWTCKMYKFRSIKQDGKLQRNALNNTKKVTAVPETHHARGKVNIYKVLRRENISQNI